MSVRKAIKAAIESLKEKREIINNLNIYPVPDGDTGTNMYTTLLVALEKVESLRPHGFLQELEALSEGSLYGSKGNSGFILSEFICGFSNSLSVEARDASSEPKIQSLIKALGDGSMRARHAVDNPLEGTILTVLSDITDTLAKEKPKNLHSLLKIAHLQACESLRRTPILLKPLAEAGVVDAGGAGIVAILEGILSLLGISFMPFEWKEFEKQTFTPVYDGPRWGLEFSLRNLKGIKATRDSLKRELEKLGDSLVISGEKVLRVHIHTDDHESVLNVARNFGNVELLEIAEFPGYERAEIEPLKGKSRKIGVITCSPGEGLSKIFRDFGCSTIEAGPGARPSTGRILEEIEKLNCDVTIILPNDADTLPSAKKAAEIAKERGHDTFVIPTISPVQAIVACEEYLEDKNPWDVKKEMSSAAMAVSSGTVAKAVRNTKIGDVEILEGHFFGLTETGVVASSFEIEPVVLRVCSSLCENGNRKYFIFVEGKGFSENLREVISESVKGAFPQCEQEWFKGGQAYYILMIGAQ